MADASLEDRGCPYMPVFATSAGRGAGRSSTDAGVPGIPEAESRPYAIGEDGGRLEDAAWTC